MRPLSIEGQKALRVAEDLIDHAKLDEAESVLLNIIRCEEPNRLVLHNIEDVYQRRLLSCAERVTDKYPESPMASYFHGRLLSDAANNGRSALLRALSKAEDDPAMQVMCHYYLMKCSIANRRMDLFTEELNWLMSLDELSPAREGAFSYAVWAISACDKLDLHQQLRDVAETPEIVQSLPLIAQLLRAKADELELGQKIVASIG
ncbi:MAG: hypothetical protein JNL58_04275 [Planctomyces sp.]|nr:hypothetical protein [Planctomyces sp.]